MRASTTTKKSIHRVSAHLSGFACALLFAASGVQAGVVIDAHGNVGYDTAAECDAAVAAGNPRYYQPVTVAKPKRRAGEVAVRTLPLRQLAQLTGPADVSAGYAYGACDVGTRHHVTPELVGKYVPFSPDMIVNVYVDRRGSPLRVTMAQCDNSFQSALPRPVEVVRVAAPVVMPPIACYVDALAPIRPVSTPGACVEGMQCYRSLLLSPSTLPGVERAGAAPGCPRS